MKTNQKMPIGVRDYEGNELQIKTMIGNKLIELFEFYSYTNITTPVFEYIDVFATDLKDTKNLYIFNNNEGNLLALRSDGTKAISRVISLKNNVMLPYRYCYQMNSIKRLDDLNGDSQEITQCGVELIGGSTIKADCEVIKLAILALKKIGLPNFTLHLYSNDFLKKFFDDFNLDEEARDNVIELIKSKNLVELERYFDKLNMKPEIREMMSRFLISVGDINLFKNIMASLNGLECAKSLEYLEKIYNALGTLNQYVSFDFSITTYDSYYTGIYFYACLEDTGKEILKGGRYDDLVHNPNVFKAIPAVGFALEIDYILKYAMNLYELPRYEKVYYYSEEYNNDMEEEIIALFKEGKTKIVVSTCSTLELAKSEFEADASYDKMIVYGKDFRTEVLK